MQLRVWVRAREWRVAAMAMLKLSQVPAEKLPQRGYGREALPSVGGFGQYRVTLGLRACRLGMT
jgi:hypothetical protein